MVYCFTLCFLCTFYNMLHTLVHFRTTPITAHGWKEVKQEAGWGRIDRGEMQWDYAEHVFTCVIVKALWSLPKAKVPFFGWMG